MTILISIIVFLSVIMALVAAIVFVEDKLFQHGEHKIEINGEGSPVACFSGTSLLAGLQDHEIYLPSGCGGKGTCGDCKCQVFEGAGQLLPSEAALIDHKLEKQHYRLACQVKVREDMKIAVPDEVFNAVKFECVVRSNENIATFIKELIIELPKDVAWSHKSGQYIQIDIPTYQCSFRDFDLGDFFKDLWDRHGLRHLNAENDEATYRAYSLANHPNERDVLKCNIRIALPPVNNHVVSAGIASSYLFNLKPKDKVTVCGPFGSFLIKETNREMVYIGGGVGMAPLRSHLFDLLEVQKEDKRLISFWYGARSVKDLFYINEFEVLSKKHDNFSFHVALSEPDAHDAWEGATGFIHQVCFDQYLQQHPEPEEIEYYLCGPTVMNEAVIKMLDSLGVEEDKIAFDNFG
ncbi:NADH:ubiquinone reductase (Na(+)-transporting) subunit F [Candidatus Omnitrophota bacterium]